MARLIAFGASYVYGQGLPDCFVEPACAGPRASELAWPSIVSKKLGRECVNMSSPGASNLEILDTILHFNFDPSDVVMIMWVDPARDAIYTAPKKSSTVAHWVSDPAINVKEWLKLHNEYDLALRTWRIMHHAFLYLSSHTFYFLDGHHDRSFYEFKPEWASGIQILTTRMDMELEKHPTALDNMHPGITCHESIAELIYNEITCK